MKSAYKGMLISSSDNCRIEYNYLIAYNMGVGLGNSKNCFFYNNYFHGIDGVMRIGRSPNTRFIKNTCYGNEDNFWIYENSDNSIISKNYFNVGMYSSLRCKSSNVEISDNVLEGIRYGITLYNASRCLIEGNLIKKCYSGITVNSFGDNNTIRNNLVTNVHIGIYLNGEGYNLIYENQIKNTHIGFRMDSPNNKIYHNNIMSTVRQLENLNNNNTWDNGNGEGNYWSDYTGSDTDSDGVGDTDLPHQGVDYYPLMSEY